MEYNWQNIREPLLTWYRHKHRELKWRNTTNPYHIWLSEIMLQQTRVEAVKGYYDRFLKEIPDIEALSKVPEEKLLKLWEGLGYYNRARNMQRAAQLVMDTHNGEFPVVYDEVLALPGIGEYTAGAICSICYDLPTPAVDGNVLRVMMRLSNCRDNIDENKTKKKVKEQLVPIYETGSCRELTQALMELGAVVCIPNGTPKCDSCPLKEQCLAFRENTYGGLPVRTAKKQRRIEEKTVFVLHYGMQYGIRKRTDNGLLANMWEFFHIEGKLSVEEAIKFVSDHGFEPVLLEKEIPYTHVFSHVEWRMTAYYIACHKRQKGLKWVDRKDLEEQYALPTAFKVFLEKEL